MLKWTRSIGALLLVTLPCIPSLAHENESWIHIRSLTKADLVEATELRTATTKNDRIRAFLTLADQAINSSSTKALEHLERAEELIGASTGSDVKTVAKAIRCQLEHRMSLPDAEKSCRELSETNIESEIEFTQAFVHATQMIYLYNSGRHQASQLEAERALKLATDVDDTALLAAAHNMIGLHLSTKLRPRMSLPHFESALEHADRLPFSGPKTITQLNLASSYTYLGRGHDALKVLNEAKTSPTVTLYPHRRLVIQSMIGQARASLGDTENAESELQSVLDEVSDTVLPDGMTFGYTGLGIIQLAEGRADDALASFDKVLDITGKSFKSDLQYSRIQLIAVPYASALRESRQISKALELLNDVIDAVPPQEPDQLLVDAYRELALTLEAANDFSGAKVATEKGLNIESSLWDASFQYQIARLNASLESDRRKFELLRAQEREVALRDIANREVMLRRQTWLIGAMIIAVIVLLFSRRLQKRIADAERAAKAELEHQVKERTHKLEVEMAKGLNVEVERRQLAEKMFEGEKLRAMGQITAGVAHDFNNLMTVVTLGADQLKDRVQDENNLEAAETLEHIRGAAETGAKITRGLLAYVREQPLQPENVQLDDFLREALPMFRNTLGEHFKLVTSLVACRVLVDKGQLTSAVLNLLLNAKEAMATGGTIEVTLRNVENEARIKVSDTGTGMDPSVVDRAFDPFFTTKNNGEGSGLGLSMVYGFARQSDGDLAINSTPGEGTSVTLTLPAVPGFETEKASTTSGVRHIPKNVRVLAVEDRKELLHVLKLSLSQLGADVTCASSADEALQIVSEEGLPDLLVTDIVMPGQLDGLGLVTHLRKQNANLPVILMSGYTRDVDDECTFLHKPFSFDQLEEAVEHTLSTSRLVARRSQTKIPK